MLTQHSWQRSFELGWRNLWRDFRSGELNLLIISVVLAVAALTAVGFFSDRLQAGLWRDARQLLGGDAVVVSDKPTPANFQQKAQALGLKTNDTLSFPSMARADDAKGGETKLVALKAVSEGYPLRGQMSLLNLEGRDAIKPDLSKIYPAKPTREVPQPGQAWVDPALLEVLNLQLGDALWLGDKAFQIAALIDREPDRGAGFMNFAPRVMIHQSDVMATGLIQPASRLSYRMAVAGEASQANVQQFLKWARDEVAKPEVRGIQVESMESGRPEMRQTLDRAEKFLNLVALLAALLCAVAVALAARTFASKHLDGCALLRVLGQSQKTLSVAYAFEFITAGLAASLLGVIMGYGIHHAFIWLLAGLVDVQLPPSSGAPALLGLGMGLTLLLAFGLPPVLQLAKVPAMRVIRRDMGGLQPASLGVLLTGLVGFAGALMWASRDVKLGLMTVGGFAIATSMFAGATWLVLKLLRKWVPSDTTPRWLLLATRQVMARPVYAVVQVSALSVGLLALVLLVLLRTDLISSWRKATPVNAPDRFVINVQPDQTQAFQDKLSQVGVKDYDWYPMIRGRLVAVNGRETSPQDYTDERAKRLVDREFNLSAHATQPEHNAVVKGQWQEGEKDAVSVEVGIAQTLGLKMGDRLRFDVGGVISEGRVTSLRKVDWGSMRANFFVIYPVDNLPEVPLSYMAAFKTPDVPAFERNLLQQFPNVTSVDLRASLMQVQKVLDQVIRAVEFLFAFTLMAGLLVLTAAVTSTREERKREFAIMRALGATGRLLSQVQTAELMGVGLMAGFLASMVAELVGWGLARFVFEFEWTASLWVPVAGALTGAVLAWVAGWWGLAEVLRQPVSQTLRQASE
ncbi:ABC transporter permease [Limnohabitans sp. MMS-10A-178]|uniref:ABC transporter permease n=1 Tax=Limnohabitans sp. MMS-10A-178 TaxID=1835767 RepID=UPI000D3B1D9A|nr:FtsX-like permease family protein [Limnohabitans sp. MMS-10A-178]PUE17679.1 ABC transporter permease [Limnohabitans sp. MMS-10A-178]